MVSWATKLTVLSLSGQALVLAIGISLARHLSVEGFESYAVASAAFILMVTLVPQGIEKYSLKVIPPLLDRNEAGTVRAYLAFGCRRILLACVLVGVPVALVAWHADDLRPDTRVALVISCASLPAGALVHLAIEVLTALGRPFAATLIFRIVVPAIVLALIGAGFVLVPRVHGATAIAAWGAAWCIALGMMLVQIRRAVPRYAWSAPASPAPEDWAREARPFWFYRVAMAVLSQAGVVALDRLQPSASAVGAFAVALGIASITQVLATSTNRVYASRLSRLLDGGDLAAIAALRRARLRWIALPLAVWLIVVLVFARDILSLFRPEFAEDGTMPLRLLAICIAVTTLLSVEPTYFKHRDRNRTLFRSVIAATVLELTLLAYLVPAHGATGAAIAYGVAMTLLYIHLARQAHLDFREIPAG